MANYVAAVFADLEMHSEAWNQMPREQIVALIGEYRYLAESMASQYGTFHRNFMGDGHLFLFETADAAVQFALKLIDAWKCITTSSAEPAGSGHMPLRLGCHFGECTPLEGGDAWIGRALNLAKRVEESAEPDSLFVTENVLELVDLPLYVYEDMGRYALKGDHLPSRALYCLNSGSDSAVSEKLPEQLSAETWFLKGVAFIGTSAENSDEEAEQYQEALVRRPDYPEAHNNLGALHRARGQMAQAEEHYRVALTLRPNYPEACYNYAVLLHLLGDREGSSARYQEALRLREDYVDAHYGYGTLLKDSGELSGAEDHFREALSLRPQYAEVHNNYAILLEDKGDLAQAEAHYIESLRIRPDYAEAHYNLALLKDSQGDPGVAEEHYREAIRLRPEYPEAINNLAITLHAKGDLSGAELQYQAVLRLRPNEPDLHYNYGLLLNAKGEQTAAEEQFSKASQLTQ